MKNTSRPCPAFPPCSNHTALIGLVLLIAIPRLAWAGGLQAGDKVAICGDSITEQKIYSAMIETYLIACQPQPKLQAHQFGWSGEWAGGFRRRMEFEVLPFQPTVATTCYGMNDGAYAEINPERQQKYREDTESFIKEFKDAGVRFIVVGSPGAVDSDTFDQRARKGYPADAYNTNTLADLTEIARQVAAGQGVAFADIHRPMMEVMAKAKAKYGGRYHVAGSDGIHPAANGHLVMAYAMLKALGCDGELGTITVDLAKDKAAASSGHKVVSCQQGRIELESTRYPFCFFGDPADPNSARGVLEFLPFNQDLNRFQLVIQSASSPRLKITWGAESKDFTAAELAKGINLAEAFPDNPFSAPFQAVYDAVLTQQKFETPAVKSILHALPGWTKTLPEEQEAYNQIARGVVRKAQQLSAASIAAVVPVRHSLLVEPVQ